MEITEVVIPDPEVVLERAHSSKFSGSVIGFSTYQNL
jgi:hypothetical protein